MSEEEKKAVELLNKLNFSCDSYYIVENGLAKDIDYILIRNAIKTIKNLIEKQQKELNLDIKVEINEDYIKINDKCFYIKKLQEEFGTEIKRLKKENKELQKELERIKSLDINKLVEEYETGQLIPKSKIEDKIKKLTIAQEADIGYYQIEFAKDILKELLESEE